MKGRGVCCWALCMPAFSSEHARVAAAYGCVCACMMVTVHSQGTCVSGNRSLGLRGVGGRGPRVRLLTAGAGAGGRGT
jgi:hypothetical protein